MDPDPRKQNAMQLQEFLEFWEKDCLGYEQIGATWVYHMRAVGMPFMCPRYMQGRFF